jgi:hypothetical protein
VPHPFKKPVPTMPSRNLHLGPILDPDPEFAARCRAACDAVFSSRSVSATACRRLEYFRAWRTNADSRPSGAKARTFLLSGAQLAGDIADGVGHTSEARRRRLDALVRLSDWVSSAPEEIQLAIGGFDRLKSVEAWSWAPAPRLAARRSFDDLVRLIHGMLRAARSPGRGRARADVKFDFGALADHLAALAAKASDDRAGRRRDESLDWVVLALASLWQDAGLGPFRASKKEPTFGRFAAMVRAVDPTVPDSAIGTAMRRAASALKRAPMRRSHDVASVARARQS